MTFRPLAFAVASLLVLSLAGTAPELALAQYDSSYNSGSQGRVYTEPGEPYDAGRNGGSQTAQSGGYDRGYDALRNNGSSGRSQAPYNPDAEAPDDSPSSGQSASGYRQPSAPQPTYQQPTYQQPAYRQPDYQQQGYQQGYRQQPGYQPQDRYQPPASSGPGQAYAPPPADAGAEDRGDERADEAASTPAGQEQGVYEDTYSDNEILDAGHRFFGKTTKGLAKVIAYAFQRSGRPNAYILGEEGGGALIAGLRYGEGTLYTKWGEQAKVYWQGPSIGYDFGAEGAKTMILVYGLRNIDEIYERYAGIDGSAYLVGGVGITFQKRGRVTLAPIRTGVGVRLGANVGYLKYSRTPTWNPF
jgi:hypothetical protein